MDSQEAKGNPASEAKMSGFLIEFLEVNFQIRNPLTKADIEPVG